MLNLKLTIEGKSSCIEISKNGKVIGRIYRQGHQTLNLDFDKDYRVERKTIKKEKKDD